MKNSQYHRLYTYRIEFHLENTNSPYVLVCLCSVSVKLSNIQKEPNKNIMIKKASKLRTGLSKSPCFSTCDYKAQFSIKDLNLEALLKLLESTKLCYNPISPILWSHNTSPKIAFILRLKVHFPSGKAYMKFDSSKFILFLFVFKSICGSSFRNVGYHSEKFLDVWLKQVISCWLAQSMGG